MRMLLRRSFAGWPLLVLAALALAAWGPLAHASTPAVQAQPSQAGQTFHFNLVPSMGITACLQNARGEATIVSGPLNDELLVSVSGLPANTGFDLFVIQLPNKPFGVAWYQSDLQTDGNGKGSATVRGIFNVETFSVSIPGSSNPFPPTHQYHLGLWFNDPQVPFDLGCEPGAKMPTVTPFNGEQNAGIQVLNTSNFPDDAGPLSHVEG